MKHPTPSLSPSELLADFSAGVGIGLTMESVVLEGFAHQSLAHRTIEYSPVLATTSRAILNGFGLSVNGWAAGHRVHHALEQIAPIDAPLMTVKAVAANISRHVTLEEQRDKLLFPGYEFSDDPLLREDDGRLSFRHSPPLERLVNRGGAYRVLPAFALILAGGAINKLTGRSRPWLRSAAAIVGTGIGLSAEQGIIAFSEYRAGTTDGRINHERILPPFKKRLQQHQAHHNRPWELYAGQSRRSYAAQKVLQRLGLTREPSTPNK